MRGLIRKDLYMIWRYGRMLLISAVFLGMSLVAEQNFFFVKVVFEKQYFRKFVIYINESVFSLFIFVI